MDKILYILAFGLLLLIIALIVNFVKLICELCRPNYLKAKSFFLMENDSDLLEITAKEGLQVTIHYADHIYANQTEEGCVI